MTTTVDGIRGAPAPHGSTSDPVRIVGIGDSVMFGWGVRDHEPYLAVLTGMLDRRAKDRAWSVVNLAVPGYNTVQEVETLKELALSPPPDVVVLHFIHNDVALPNFIRAQEDYLATDRSFLARYMNRTVKRVRLTKAPYSLERGGFEADPHVVPAQYRDMVGIGASVGAMRELGDLGRTHGFEVILLMVEIPDPVREVAVEFGFHVVDLRDAMSAYETARGIIDSGWWRLSDTDPHLSPEAHRVVAEALHEALRVLRIGCAPDP